VDAEPVLRAALPRQVPGPLPRPPRGRRGSGPAESLKKPTWNGNELGTVYPWGTIRTPTPEANKAEAERLSPAVRDEIRARTFQYLETFDYKGFI